MYEQLHYNNVLHFQGEFHLLKRKDWAQAHGHAIEFFDRPDTKFKINEHKKYEGGYKFGSYHGEGVLYEEKWDEAS